MASSDKKRKTKQKHKASKGWARAAQAKATLVRTRMKIKRFKRYAQEVATGKRVAPVKRGGKLKGQPNPLRWSTAGLETHLQTLQTIIKNGKTT